VLQDQVGILVVAAHEPIAIDHDLPGFGDVLIFSTCHQDLHSGLLVAPAASARRSINRMFRFST